MRQTSAARCRGHWARMPSRREPQLALTEPFGCGGAAVGVGESQARGTDHHRSPSIGVIGGRRSAGRVIQQRAATGVVVGESDPRAVGIALARKTIIVVKNIARSEAPGIDAQRLPAGSVELVARAVSQWVDGHGLTAIGVVNQAVAVSIGIHERDNPAGCVVDLGRPKPVRVQRGRDTIRTVVNCGRDLTVCILDPVLRARRRRTSLCYG